jgi:ADP-heptose:LPS heptosyltransferase
MSDRCTRRALVLFPGALGDFICFLPTLERLGRGQVLHLLAHSEFAKLLPNNIRVRSIECYEIYRLFVPQGGSEMRLREFYGAYDAVYSWTGSGQAVFIQELQFATEGKAQVFAFRPLQLRMHQTDYYLSCLGEPSSEMSFPTIPLQSEAVAWSARLWRQPALSDKPVLVLAPGSGAREKNWSAGSFQIVADWWRERVGGAVVIVAGPVEEERGDFEPLCRNCVIVRQLDLAQLAALLARSTVYLGNDSGVTHLAATLRVRTIALYGPTDPLQWAPRGEKVTVISRGVECSPCPVEVMKSCLHRKCLTTLEAAEVIRKLKQLPEVAALTT